MIAFFQMAFPKNIDNGQVISFIEDTKHKNNYSVKACKESAKEL